MSGNEKNGKIIYVFNKRPAIFIEQMKKLGYEVLVGDDVLNEEWLASCWALWPGRFVVTEEVLQKAPNLKLIVKQGVGLDRIDISACTSHGVCVANTPKSNYISVSEHTIFLLLAAAKKIVPIFLYLRVGGPDYKFLGKGSSACDVYGKTLSIIGLGRIGLRVAELAHGLGMEIVGYDMFRKQEDLPDYIKLEPSMDEVIRQADFLSLHVSGIEENRNLIGEKQLAMMKPTAVLINTTRGFVVDEQALYEALKNHVIAGAALDVFSVDPVKPDNPLLALNNVVATPHTAANTAEASVRASLECVKIVTDFAQGIRPESAAN